jgi:Flp pilus assembly protein TadD
LQQGIQSWRSSLEVKKKPAIEAPMSTAVLNEADTDVSGETRANVFEPEVDLQEYLKRISSTDTGIEQEAETADDYEIELESIEQLKKPVMSNKAVRATSPRTKPTRPTDVEDVLAAGIGGFIEAVGQANKTKIAYGLVYIALAGLFTYACFDVSRKFPAVETIPGQQVQSASLGALNLNESQGSDEAIARARSLVSAGKTSEAINLLQVELQSGKLLHNRDLLRIELAALLNGLAEQHLRGNQFQESVARYKQALEILPSDAALQLRLGNALYYQGTLGTTDSAKAGALADAVSVLETITSKNPDNLQAQRLLALVSEARGEKKTATAAWKKVKALASANSAEFKEADSHLK